MYARHSWKSWKLAWFGRMVVLVGSLQESSPPEGWTVAGPTRWIGLLAHLERGCGELDKAALFSLQAGRSGTCPVQRGGTYITISNYWFRCRLSESGRRAEERSGDGGGAKSLLNGSCIISTARSPRKEMRTSWPSERKQQPGLTSVQKLKLGFLSRTEKLRSRFCCGLPARGVRWLAEEHAPTREPWSRARSPRSGSLSHFSIVDHSE